MAWAVLEPSHTHVTVMAEPTPRLCSSRSCSAPSSLAFKTLTMQRRTSGRAAAPPATQPNAPLRPPQGPLRHPTARSRSQPSNGGDRPLRSGTDQDWESGLRLPCTPQPQLPYTRRAPRLWPAHLQLEVRVHAAWLHGHTGHHSCLDLVLQFACQLRGVKCSLGCVSSERSTRARRPSQHCHFLCTQGLRRFEM
jgi:hypothetical protein